MSSESQFFAYVVAFVCLEKVVESLGAKIRLTIFGNIPAVNRGIGEEVPEGRPYSLDIHHNHVLSISNLSHRTEKGE